MKPSFEEERQAISKCIFRDRGAWEILVRRFSNLAYQTVRSMFLARQAPFSTKNLEAPHKMVFQGVFGQDCIKLKVYQGRSGCTPASWIRMVTVRTVLHHLRKKRVDSVVGRKRKRRLRSFPGGGERISSRLSAEDKVVMESHLSECEICL